LRAKEVAVLRYFKVVRNPQYVFFSLVIF